MEYRDTIVVGAGISGLVVSHKLQLHRPDHQFLILEKSSRAGGAIRSFSEDGYLAEWGPHGFLDNCLQSRELLVETGLESECVRAPLATYVRYVCMNGKLLKIPQSPLKIVRAPLISWPDKFRVLGELFKKPLAGEPTVAKWAEQRFGRALLPYVDAVFTGTYAGDYNELKIDAVMPGVRQMEKQYGSIIRGALAKARQAKKNKAPGQKLQMPAMTSFAGGMQRLPDKLADLLGKDRFRFDCAVTGLQREATGWLVTTSNESYKAANVVLALPLNQSLALLNGLAPNNFQRKLPEAWINTVVFGFKGASLSPGFGFLSPEREKRFTLGTLFSSNMFPNRAPQGHIVFETLIGGRRHPERLDCDDDSLIRQALDDVRGLLDLPSEPVYTKVLRPDGGIPQLEKGYTTLLRQRNEIVSSNPGLFVCGFGWEGIGLNDMIKTACSLSEQIIADEQQSQDQAEVKKVYF